MGRKEGRGRRKEGIKEEVAREEGREKKELKRKG